MAHRVRFPSHFTPLSRNTPFSESLQAWEPREQLLHDEKRNVRMRWTSRAHRKGIPAELVREGAEEKGARGGRKGWEVKRRKVRWWGWDWKDISWWIAALFTLGSIWWCINAILFFCYFSNTSLAFTNTEAATGFLGGTTFLVGSYLGWVESLNPAQEAHYDYDEDEPSKNLVTPDRPTGSLGHNRKHFGSHPPPRPPTRSPSPTPLSSCADSSSPIPHSSPPRTTARPRKWRWYGATRSLGYLANTIQLFGAVAFQISVICGLPGVLPASGSEGGSEQAGRSERLWLGLYWGMQVVGAPCFAIAGALFCYEVQSKWWKWKPLSVGWQIGAWNVIGGFGFWFSGIFGIWRQTSIADPGLYQKWGTAFSTFWGSWAFLIGSYIQLWETLNKKSS